MPAVFAFALAGMARAESPQEEIQRQVPAALAILEAWHAQKPAPSTRKIRIVYWTPADREPAPRYHERLSRTLLDIREFYLREMRRMGFGDRTFQLDMAGEGLINIHLVKGAKPYKDYDVKSGSAIRTECLPALKEAGIEAERETLVIFCNMSNWDADAGTMSQNSPYYAGGSARSGTAWQVDSPLLDIDRIADQKMMIQDGQYGRISVGKYNSIFIGGIAHELGHALGLPHNAERPDQREAFGTALMGGGNRTYGDDRRGEGRGSFLTLAHALRLASHPAFRESVRATDGEVSSATLEDVTIRPDGKSFAVSGVVKGDPPVYAVIGYMDPAGGGDYDATTCTAVPDTQGRFTLNCNALRAGKPGSLRIVALQAHGNGIGDRTLAIPYAIAKDGAADLTTAMASQRLAPLVKALNAKDADAVAAEVKVLEKSDADALTREVAKTLAATLDAQMEKAPSDAEGDACRLSDAAWASGRVGWGKPTANRLPGDTALLRAGGRLFARGLYAHAPSAYRWELGGRWARLTGHAGMAEGHGGTVVFVVLGDGKELWRSGTIKEDGLVEFDVKVQDVKQLELRVENAGDGNGSDWGVWLEPTLRR